MKMKILSVICILLLTNLSFPGCKKDQATEPSTEQKDPLVPEGRRLREIVADKYSDGSVIIGGTTGAWAFGTYTARILDREFSYVTPENDFKQWNILPDDRPLYNWEETDAWISHIQANDQILRMHCPIGPQCSQWAQDDSRTASELTLVLKKFMQGVCERYNGLPGVVSLDVVNEVLISGNWHKNKPGSGWENPWFIIGQDTDKNKTPLFIKMAFEVANQYGPDLQMIFNHHEGPENRASWNKIKETIIYLRDLGLRVDGIGWQAHVDVGWDTENNINALRELVAWAHENDLEFHVTEASVWMVNGTAEAELQKQGRTYAAILNVLLQNRANGKVGWNIWHIEDNHSWRPELFASVFDSTYTAKPAYYAIQQALEQGE